MRQVRLVDGADLTEWRAQARVLLREGIPPEQVQWQSGPQADLLPPEPSSSGPPAPRGGEVGTVPRAFLALAALVLAHADPRRHAVLYRLLWRLVHGERALLRMVTDDDVAWALRAAKAVRREKHKMKAFVRFREMHDTQGPVFVAWFEPEHEVLAQVAPFFVRRFAGMRWSILTPTRSAHWDGQTFTLGAGASRADAPGEDALEDLWRTYFANIFNPARLKVGAMVKEMPVRYWKNLPEATLIPGLIRDASARMDAMVQAQPTVPRKAFPAPAAREPVHAGDLHEIRREAAACRACPLWQPATQTVFGEGPVDARAMLLGEQPGDQEDLAGQPFVGPAGRLLDRALGAAGIDRRQLYVTNTVKHFKFTLRGKRRLHARANAAEQAACRMWLEAELARVQPRLIVCLGAMAAQAILGPDFRLLEERGRWFEGADGTRVMATVHPSYLLRLPAVEQEAAFDAFLADMQLLGTALSA